MSGSPYRDVSSGENERASIAYPTVPPPRLLFRAYVVLVAVVFATATWAIARNGVAGIVTFIGFLVAMSWWRSRRNATTSIDIEGLMLTLRAPRQKPITLPLRDLLDVRIQTTELVAASNVRPGPGFGMLEAAEDGVTFESKIGLILRGRSEPLCLHSPRRSMTETDEEYPRVLRFLRAQGWLPEGERPK